MPTGPLSLDRLIRARAIHSMTGEVYRAVGLRGAEITAASAEPDGLDDLAGTGTVTTDAGDLTLLPAFADSHEHLMEASRNTLLVPVDQAHSVAEFTAMVATAARAAAPGAWIMTSMAWHESNLAENRPPTGTELDAAVWQVSAFAPAPSQAQLAEALGRGSAAYAALGIGIIREAMINTDELLAYQDAAERGMLSVRVRPLIRIGNELTAAQATALIGGLGVRSGFGDDWLRIWGLKFVMDGGVEGGALEQPYTSDPAQSGHLNWDPTEVNPLDEWLAMGADLAAGTDIARPFDPLLNVWGIATRGTKAAGVQGPEHAIGVAAALELYTIGTARLNHNQDRLGSITPGKLADIVAYPADPLTADLDDLPGLTPAFTIVGGRPVHDPGGRLGFPR